MRILLIAGGWSSEREVSLSGARNIGEALTRLGHEVVPFDPLTSLGDLPAAAAEADFAFLNLHGSPGEDGLVQAMLESFGCPYQGSGPRGSFLALNKCAAKTILRAAGLPTPDWQFLPRRPEPGWRLEVPLPVFVKPNLGGSSIGMSLVREPAMLDKALDTVFAVDREALAEAFAQGVEVTCAVLGAEPLPPILIKPKTARFFDYDSKYSLGGAEEICPAPIGAPMTATIQDLALRAHELLGLSGYSRTDFILTENGPLVLETNTLPGMTGTSLVPQAAAVVGLSFTDLVARLIELGLAAHGPSRAQSAAASS